MEKYLYRILGITESATDEEIKKAFRESAKQHHPDIGGDEEEFKKAVMAYNILIDPSKRETYDNTGKLGEAEIDKFERAQQTVKGMVKNYLNRDDTDKINLIDSMKQTSILEIEDNEKKINIHQKRLEKLRKVRSKVIPKKELELDIVLKSIDEEIDDVNTTILQLQRNNDSWNLIISLMEYYDFTMGEI